jgi:putative glutamine amidotransferase
VVEAVEGTGDAYLVGVQWHPEMFEEETALFGGFISAAREFHSKQ